LRTRKYKGKNIGKNLIARDKLIKKDENNFSFSLSNKLKTQKEKESNC